VSNFPGFLTYRGEKEKKTRRDLFLGLDMPSNHTDSTRRTAVRGTSPKKKGEGGYRQERGLIKWRSRKHIRPE